VAAIELIDDNQNAEDYWDALEREGGIVEERIESDRLRSPSV
jgi:hypothetical protein